MIFGIPGVNGLGKTKGVEKAPGFFLGKSEILSLNLEDIKEQEAQISDFVSRLDGGRLFFIGGDHSISYSIGKYFFEKFPKGKLLVFDAHPDLMNPFSEPTNEEWLRALIENKKIDVENILIVGVRKKAYTVDKLELNYAKKKGIKIIFSEEFGERKGEILDFISSGELYFSFDVDVFDKSIFFATGFPEKNGLNEEQVFDILNKVGNNLKFFDLVEYNPLLDKKESNLKLLKKVLKTVVGE